MAGCTAVSLASIRGSTLMSFSGVFFFFKPLSALFYLLCSYFRYTSNYRLFLSGAIHWSCINSCKIFHYFNDFILDMSLVSLLQAFDLIDR